MFLCEEIISNSLDTITNKITAESMPYIWKMFIHKTKFRMRKDEYDNLLMFVDELIRRQSSRKAIYLLKKYLYFIPN